MQYLLLQEQLLMLLRLNRITVLIHQELNYVDQDACQCNHTNILTAKICHSSRTMNLSSR